MREQDFPSAGGEPYEAIRFMQEALEQLGYYLYPVAKEHTEAAITNPLVHRIRTQIKRRGFEKVAGKLALTFSGYFDDPREIFAIPEIRVYYQQLDHELSELPALVAYLPQITYNGPGNHLMLLGTVDEAINRPEIGGYDVHVADAELIVADAIQRIHQASRTYHLRAITTQRVIQQFLAGATHRIGRQP
jgi:hypothetical protein